MMLDTLLALGLLLSTATELRLPGVPIGPGEMFLVAWAVLMLFREADRLGSPLTPALARLLIFWLLFAVALSVGTLAGYAIGDTHDPKLFLHDVMAYPLLTAVSCLSVAGPHAAPRLHRVGWLLAGFGNASLALLVVIAWGWIHLAPIDPWYWDRLRGWSANPEQLALLCTVLALLALYLADSATRIGGRIAAVACAILPIYVGRLTKSDTLSLVLIAAGAIFVALKLRKWLLLVESKPTVRGTFAWIAILALPLLLISVIPLGSVIADQLENAARGLAKNNGENSQQEAELRFQIWREGISRGLESGTLGLGPGPHLEIPASLVSARKSEVLPKYVDTPEMNGMPNFEAHNTLVDLFIQGGLLAILSFLWIAATALLNTYKARLAGLTTMLCGVGAFGLANLIVRQPLFWFTIALCLVAGTGTPSAPPRNAS
ncbi:MAG: O-antigen ligase family protein [Bradyrhizobiaceae bacterium]|nr:O-antigen ligase family protein [Bradyrhizobiaceae bacterium]